MIHPKALSFSFMGARHTQNDDASIVNQEQGIYVLCDGVSEGGHGNLAAQLVTKNLQEKLTEANHFIKKNGAQLLGPKRLLAMQEQLLNAFAETQQNLQKAAMQNPNYKLASTTCIVLWMDGRFAIMAHLGDSRAYLYRAGKLYQLTKDHSGLDELIKMGIAPDVAAKNPMARALSRAFGNARYTQPDLLKIEFQPNDLLMVCTDGVYTALPQLAMQQLVQAMVAGKDVAQHVEQCARQSGDDATLLQIFFPPQPLQKDGNLLQASDRIKLIQQTPLSKYFDYIQKSHIAAICDIEEFNAGSMVIQEGTDGETMYIVAKGTLEVLVRGQHIAYKKAGEFMGEIALVQQTKRSATVIAKEDTILLSLKQNDLFEVFKKDPELERLFYKSMLEMTLDRMVEQGKELAQLKGV